jgi:hypothetical protein
VNCGVCPTGQNCVSGQCVTPCTPKTCAQQGVACGTTSDGCGGTVSCGSCPAGQICSSGACVACTPSCTGKVCGADGCGGSCGSCPTGQVCSAPGTCSAACTAFNNGAGCTATEQRFLNKSPDCYSCLVNTGCLDDAAFGDTGHECGDVTGTAAGGAQAGTARSDLCLATIDCILSTSCASTDVAICYCGSLGAGDACTTSTNPSAANGPCASIELAALEHSSTDAPSAVVTDFFNLILGGGRANQIFACAHSGNACPMCLQ